ncbi:MAG TPA: hypothetical protein VKG38_07275 [Solirubrobacteraceae bacterium]|nr:hypothetical protein [Solirubrobacteraceae bacterium]
MATPQTAAHPRKIQAQAPALERMLPQASETPQSGDSTRKREGGP